MPAPAVVIAASNLMPSLRERLADDGELVVFPDTEPIQALQAILEHRPSLIVLERLFAATPRGAALINRIKNDPAARSRGSARDVAFRRLPAVVSKPSAPRRRAPARARARRGRRRRGRHRSAARAAVAAEPPPRPLDWHGTRRAPRHRIRDGVEIQLDGNPAQVVDLSQVGAQVVSQTILRPNQKVRVSMPNDDFVMRFRGSIAWAKFELPEPSAPPRYRAGVEFADADATAVESYCEKNKK